MVGLKFKKCAAKRDGSPLFCFDLVLKRGKASPKLQSRQESGALWIARWLAGQLLFFPGSAFKGNWVSNPITPPNHRFHPF